MIAIVNVSPENTPILGVNEYEVKINQRVIAKFEHERTVDGLSQCLRDAADAVDKAFAFKQQVLLEELVPMFEKIMGERK